MGGDLLRALATALEGHSRLFWRENDLFLLVSRYSVENICAFTQLYVCVLNFTPAWWQWPLILAMRYLTLLHVLFDRFPGLLDHVPSLGRDCLRGDGIVFQWFQPTRAASVCLLHCHLDDHHGAILAARSGQYIDGVCFYLCEMIDNSASIVHVRWWVWFNVWKVASNVSS